LTLYPGRSLVNNIGNDASGTHCKESNDYDVLLSTTAIDLKSIAVVASVIGSKAFEIYFRQYQSRFIQRARRLLSSVLRRIKV
jgi:hypothetical protein